MSDMKLPPALARFLRTSERLKELLGEYGAVNSARNMPGRAAEVYDRLVEVRSYASRDGDDAKAAVAAAKEVMTRCKAEAYAAAEGLRDKVLADISIELAQIRAALPSIVTQLVIELGVTSRQIAHEAETGSQ